MIHVSGQTRAHTVAWEESETNLSFVVEPDKRDEWIRVFKAESSTTPRYQLTPSTREIVAYNELLL